MNSGGIFFPTSCISTFEHSGLLRSPWSFLNSPLKKGAAGGRDKGISHSVTWPSAPLDTNIFWCRSHCVSALKVPYQKQAKWHQVAFLLCQKNGSPYPLKTQISQRCACLEIPEHFLSLFPQHHWGCVWRVLHDWLPGSFCLVQLWILLKYHDIPLNTLWFIFSGGVLLLLLLK